MKLVVVAIICVCNTRFCECQNSSLVEKFDLHLMEMLNDSENRDSTSCVRVFEMFVYTLDRVSKLASSGKHSMIDVCQRMFYNGGPRILTYQVDTGGLIDRGWSDMELSSFYILQSKAFDIWHEIKRNLNLY